MFSCSDDDVNHEIYKYEFFENSDLSINEIEGSYMKYGVISEGDKVVFKYTYIAENEELIADDEYAEFIYFKIDSNLNNFEIEGVDLISAKTILTKSCFCFFSNDENRDVNPVGSISGEKISDKKWRIDFDMTFYGEDNRIFEEIFVLR